MDWTDEYRLGIPEIDDEHRVLLECLSQLEHAIAAKATPRMLHGLLEHLVRLLRVHFLVEEALMRIHAYPGIEEHKQSHAGFLRKVQVLAEGSRHRRIDRDAIAFIATWFEEHLHSDDAQYAFFMSKAPQVAVPA